MLKKYKLLLIILGILFSMILLAWFLFSQYGTKWLEDRIILATTDLKQKGYVVHYSSLKISGNPLCIHATIQNPHIKEPHGLFEWKGQEVKITMRPWERYTLHFNFPGKQTFDLSQNPNLSLAVLNLEDAKGNVHLTSKGRLDNLFLTVNHFSEEKSQDLFLKDLSLHVNNIPDPLNLKVSLSTQVMNLDKLLNKETIEQPFMVNFVADLSGFKPEFPFPKTLADWRNGGGVLEVRLLKIDWPPILAEIEGTLTLDEGMYPLGSFTSRISGYGRAIGDMVELGWIKKKKATIAIFMLDLFASSDGKSKKQLKVPITLQNKRLSIGRAPLLKLKPIGGI